MGLDITAYADLKLVGTAMDGDDYEERFDWVSTLYIYGPTLDLWPSHIEGANLVRGGVYQFSKQWKFGAGSYSGYNFWREELSLCALGVSPETIWDDFERWKDLPFAYLINFSDCEGYIAGKTAQRLFEDFEQHKENSRVWGSDYWRQTYNDWHKAFRLAAQNGLVDFH